MAADPQCSMDSNGEASYSDIVVMLQVSQHVPAVGFQSSHKRQSHAGAYTQEILWPLVLFLVAFSVMLLPCWTRRFSTAQSRLSEVVFRHMCFANFVSTLNMMIVIPFSYQLSASLGRDAGFSGLFIGIFMLACGPASILMWFLMRRSRTLWWSGLRMVLNAAFALSFAGTFGYAVVAISAGRGLLPSSISARLAIGMRALSGVGDGLASQFIFSSFPRFTRNDEIPAATMQMYFSNMVALGLGPILAEVVSQIVPSHIHGFASVAAVQVGMSLGQWATFFVWCPCFVAPPEDREVDENDGPQRGLSSPLDALSHYILLVTCLILVAVRNFTVAAVEVVTTLLLETMYGWHHPWIGLVVGTVFLTSVPGKFLIDSLKGHVSLLYQVRLCAYAMLPGAILFFEHAPFAILCADSLVLLGMYLAHALVAGVRTQHAIEDSAIFNIDSLALLGNCILPSIGRFSGSWLSRYLIQHGSQRVYAALQAAAILVYLIAFEVGVAHVMHRSAAGSPKEQGTNLHFAWRVALVEVDRLDHRLGGDDKTTEGHRYDSIPIARGIQNAGGSCEVLKYVPRRHEALFRKLAEYDCVAFRCNPQDIAEVGGNQIMVDDALQMLVSQGVLLSPSPQAANVLGSKSALCQLSAFDFGLQDTFAYCTAAEFKQGLRKTLAYQPRVVKQDRGSSGHGVWIVKIADGRYCENLGDRICSDDERLTIMEACDNRVQELTFSELIELCVHGRTAGTSETRFLSSSAFRGVLIDQRYLPRVAEGEVRLVMVHDKVGQIETTSCATSGAAFACSSILRADAPEFADLRDHFEAEVPRLMKVLEMDMPPLLWTADFIAIDDHPFNYVVNEFSSTCPGIGQYVSARGQDLSAVAQSDAADGQNFCDIVGAKIAELVQPGKNYAPKLSAQSCTMHQKRVKRYTQR